MPSFPFTQQGNLLPFRVVNSYERLDWYALNQTGLNGQLVTFVTGGQDPINGEGYSSQAVAASYTNVYSTLFNSNRRVRPATFGDTVWEVAGITLYTTALNDENGNRILNMPDDLRAARAFVATGQNVPILKRGVLTIAQSQFNGSTPTAGYPLIASGTNGGFLCVAPSFATGSSIAPLVIGRCLSSSGAFQNGFAQIEVSL